MSAARGSVDAKTSIITLALLAAVYCFCPVLTSARGDWLNSLSIPPDGPEQMPVLYAHGFIDDGTGWARDSLFLLETLFYPISFKYARYYHFGPEHSPARFLANNGIPNWAIQWGAYTTNVYASPYTTAEDGYAFLSNEQELLRGTDWIKGTWMSHNRPIPSALDVLTASHLEMDLLDPAPWLLVPFKKELFKIYLSLKLVIHNTYNDSGRVEDKAINVLDLLRHERRPGGRLANARQINMVTHSQGSLITRAMLDMAAQASQEDAEYVANVVYNAPPFAGSSMAQLAKVFFEPEEITREVFTDPWFYKIFSETSNTAGQGTRFVVERLLRPFGFEWEPFEQSLPPLLRGPLDLLDGIHTNLDEAFWLEGSDNVLGDTLAGFLNLIRPLVGAFAGFPGFPSHDDLTPEGGIRHLTQYTTSPHVQQFVTLGESGFSTILFPTNTYAQIAANPSLLTNTTVLGTGPDDTAVSKRSATLLTETDTFGPRMTLLSEQPTFDHTDMLYGRAQQMGLEWLRVFLAAPTSLEITGEILVLDSAKRVHMVSSLATFHFESADFTRSGVSVTATIHEYRIVFEDGTGDFTPWLEADPDNPARFLDLANEWDAGERPIRLEWRSINQAGAREMIRSARFIVAGDAPRIVSKVIHTPDPREVYERPKRVIGLAIRATQFHLQPPSIDCPPGMPPQDCAQFVQDQIDQYDERLGQIERNPETDYVIRDPDTKLFVGVFHKPGDVTYAWTTDPNDPLANPVTLTNVHALTVELAGLQEGLNILHYQTRKVTGSFTNRFVGRVTFLVDHGPPRPSLFYQSAHALGYVVGPNTPIRFDVFDLETDGGAGTVVAAGFTNPPVVAPALFTLGDMGIQQQIQAMPGGAELVGGFITLTATATDLVHNVVSTNIQVYFDWTPPTLTNFTVQGGIPAGEGYVVFTNEVRISIQARDPNASEISEPIPMIGTPDGERAAFGAPLAFHQVIGPFREYTGTVTLASGENILALSVRDAFDNTAVYFTTLIYADPPASDTVALQLLTPRIDNVNSLHFDMEGNPTNFIVGGISGVVPSYDGSRFLFASSGNGFVWGDSNADMDIFLTEGGRIARVNTGPHGQQALGGQSDRAAISGNGRYAYFSSTATNLVTGVTNRNLYVKDIDTGEIAVISRLFSGAPVNRSAGLFEAAPTFDGRYVFFSARRDNYVENTTFNHTDRDVYVVDLDPDGNGYYFDDNYVTKLISGVSPTSTGNGLSRAPSVSRDGRYLVFLTASTDIHPATASNGTTVDALAMKFGTNSNGSLNVADRTIVPINTTNAFGANQGLTQFAVAGARVAPDGDTVVFTTRSNIGNTGDTNNQSLGQDVYISLGETGGGPSFINRFITWVSAGVGSQQSSETISAPFRAFSISEDRRVTASFNSSKVAWASLHTNMVPNDVNGVEDLFVRGQGGGNVATTPLPVNAIATNLGSVVNVTDGGLTPDGRYAYWVTTQSYTNPYTTGRMHLYMRRIDPPFTNQLTILVSGGGTVVNDPPGEIVSTNEFLYLDTDTVTLSAASAAPGAYFTHWSGDASGNQPVVQLAMNDPRSVTAHFAQANAPVSATASITTLQDVKSEGVTPVVDDPDIDDSHFVSIVDQPSNGVATVEGNRLFYTPNAGFSGSDSFLYQATDSYGLSMATPAGCPVTVVPVNRPPVFATLTLRAFGMNATQAREPDVSDPDTGETFTYEILNQPEHGVVTIEDGQFVYTPTAEFTGTDAFTFRVTDSAGHTISALAEINVFALPAMEDWSPNIASGLLSFTWSPADSNLAYTIEYTEDLPAAEWNPVPPTNQWPSTETIWTNTLPPEVTAPAFRMTLHDMNP